MTGPDKDCDDSNTRRIVRVAVGETLLQLGIDTRNPIEVQKDFAHLRRHRQSTHEMRGRTMFVMIGIIVSGAAAALWAGAKALLRVSGQ